LAVAAAAALAALVWLLARSRAARIVTGGEALVGSVVFALEPIEAEGWAEVNGERWRVRSRAPLLPGQRARVLSRDGLVLHIEPEDSPPAQQRSR
jgi:membrane-bound serine protease (ClpP class)